MLKLAILDLLVPSLMLKKYNPEISMLISVGAGVLVAGVIISQAVPAIDKISTLITTAQLNTEYTSALFRALGICFICQFASDSCSDAGEKALATKIELAGKIAVVLISLPLLEQITETALSLMHG